MNKPQLTGKDVYKRLVAYVLPYKWQFMLAVVAAILFAGTEAAFARLIEPLVNDGFGKGDPIGTRWIILWILCVALARAVLDFANSFYFARIGRHVIFDLRIALFKKLLTLPISFYHQSSSGVLLAKLTYDVEQVAKASTEAVTSLVKDIFTIIFLLIVMATINVWLAMIIWVTTPLIGLMVFSVSKKFRAASKSIQSSVGGVSHVVEEVIEGQTVVKTFGTHEYEKERFNKANKHNFRQNTKLARIKAVHTPVVQLLLVFAVSSVLFLSTVDFVLETIDVGKFAAFLTSAMMVIPPIKRLTKINAVIQKGIAAGESIFTLLDSEEEKDTGNQSKPRVDGKICYKNVSFSYANNDAVFDNLNLQVEAGKTLALVGRSGSGKTTLVSLLPRFYEIEQGEISVDDLSISEYTLENLRSQISLVSQQVLLFNDTVSANIAYGSDKIDQARLLEAAKAAHALEFIEELPQGFDTLVGENGVLLSGGQRQRLAIARALYKDAPILILDEATSALDTESERHIQAALENLMQNRTTLVIAHRLSTIENADSIVVLDEGKIVEQGNHKALLERNGKYAALHQMQFQETPETAS